LAVMVARVATGRAIAPRLVRSVDGKEVPIVEAANLGIGGSSLRAIRAGMFSVVNSERGTAKASRIAAPNMVMAGKTGTSQVRNISAAERAGGVVANEDLPWKRRDHALFVAFAPYDAPKYAVSVVVEHGGGGSAVAAPIARDMLLRALSGGLPPLDAYPSAQRSRIETEQNELKQRLSSGATSAKPTISGATG
jgi:penicillin-binding protein 2